MSRALRLLAVALVLSALGQPRPALGADGRAEGKQARLDHPGWLLPAWTADGPAAWTEIGAPYASTVALIAADGSFAPRNHGPAVNVWLYDADAGQLLAPAEQPPHLALDDDSLPIVTSTWAAADLQVDTTYVAGWPGADPATWFQDRGSTADGAVVLIRVHLATSAQAQRHVAAFVAVRPFGVERDVHPIGTASCDVASGALVADGLLVLAATQPATGCGTGSIGSGDVSALALNGAVPRFAQVADDAERAEAVVRFDLTVAAGGPTSLELRAPLAGIEPSPEHIAALTADTFDHQRASVAEAWRRALGRVSFEASDPQLTGAFRASQAYLLLNRRGRVPRSGPLAHDAFWVRDAAYIGQALERVGDAADNEATLSVLAAAQHEDGSLPAIVNADGPRPVVQDEWDAPGQAIAALVGHYRFGHDTAWLGRQYPVITRAARFIDGLRGRTLAEDAATRALVPSNLSAEDLGSAAWHHYWDDLWALAGYREAAFAARELGLLGDAEDFAARAADLQGTLLDSVALVQARTAIFFIPNGPEDVLSSAMARGTTPALWPIRALQGTASQDQLRASFQRYFEAWLAPRGGGYEHVEGTLWPYGGLGIAHAMLRLGMRDEVSRVVAWTLAHQTLPGTYAWGEGVNPQNGGLELGDMPHSWSAAELISLLRDMILAEDDGALVVGAGVPDTWLEPGKHVALRAGPTEYGLASVSMTRSDTDLTVTVEGTPPRGWLVRAPQTPSVALLDGVAQSIAGPLLKVPPGSHTLVLRS